MLNPGVVLEPMTQDLPSDWAGREMLRNKGQFWTPEWIADAMVEWALLTGDEIFDPAVGAGAFLMAAKRHVCGTGRKLGFHGYELYETEIRKALAHGLSAADMRHVRVGDFIHQPLSRKYSSIVANPPYIRHHRLEPEYKTFLKVLSHAVLGQPLDARSGLHLYFLIKALSLLADGGNLAFILPADVCEGKSSDALWKWVSENFRIDAVATFAAAATPFPKVDTNPIIIFISKRRPEPTIAWAHVKERGTPLLRRWVKTGFSPMDASEFFACDRSLKEGLQTGLSRFPVQRDFYENSVELGKFFKVMRGIATGCNEFFFLNSSQIKKYNLPPAAFIRAVGRTRDISSDRITENHLAGLDAAGKPTFLLFLNDVASAMRAGSIKDYLAYGEEIGVPDRPLIRQRSVWHHMERRTPPPWLFSYLGRRNCRFILNNANVVPLTSFLCVYDRNPGKHSGKILNTVLNHPATLANLPLVAKSYGGGALKVEPRQLEKLPIPLSVLKEWGLLLPDRK